MIVDTVKKLDDLINLITEKGRSAVDFNSLYLTPDIQRMSNQYQQAIESSQFGDYVGAIKQYKALLSNAPDFVAARFNLANLYKERRNLDEALHQYEIAAEYNPRDPSIFIEIGATYSDLGKKQEELEAYFHALKISPNNIRATKNIGQTYNEIGDHNKAIEWLQRALSLVEEYITPFNSPTVWETEMIMTLLELGNAYRDLGDYPTSESHFLRGVSVGKQSQSMDPGLRRHETVIWWNLGELSIRMKKWEQAEFYLEKCLDRSPSERIFQHLLDEAKRRE